MFKQGNGENIILYPFVAGIKEEVFISSALQVFELFLFDAVFRITKRREVAGLYFKEMKKIIFEGNDVKFKMFVTPIPMQYFIAIFLQPFDGHVFTLFAKFIVFSHA